MPINLWLLTLLLLPTLITATPIHQRAGGPIAKPIPSNCTLTNPLPSNTTTSQPPTSASGYRPDPDFISVNLVYQSYYLQPSRTDEDLATQCFQQCYGYGNGYECIGALFGRELPVPVGWYGSKGGEVMEGCLMFGEFLSAGSWVIAEGEGLWEGVRAVDINCPE